MGISTRTGISCLRQYLEVLSQTNILPHSIRSDRGTETMMMASAHWRLHQDSNPTIPFNKIWWYGTSTLNQRIEAWWRHMSRSQTLTWKVKYKFLDLSKFRPVSHPETISSQLSPIVKPEFGSVGLY